jgi:hypothetical protein
MSQPVVKNTQNQSDSLNYKPKLDEAASRVKTPPQEEPSSGIIDKGMSASKLHIVLNTSAN